MTTAQLTASDKDITWRQRQASMDETENYWVHGLSTADGNDAHIFWNCGTLLIADCSTGETLELIECNSFREAETIIEQTCNIKFNHIDVRWSIRQTGGYIPRPIPRR